MTLSVITDDKVIVSDDKKVTIKGDDKKASEKKKVADLHKETIIEYLTDHVSARSSELAELLGVKSTRVKNLLSALIDDGIVVAEGANRNRTYRLKEKS